MTLKRTTTFLAAAALVLVAGSAARAITGGEVIVDEYGHGYFQDDLGHAPIALPSAQMTDPLSGITDALAYDLGPLGVTPVSGDLELIEPPAGGLSDIIRFESISGHPYLFFYSDADETSSSLADTASLAQLTIQANNASVTETGLTISNVPPNNRFVIDTVAYVEGQPNGYNYNGVLDMAATVPGFDTSGLINNYHIISDGEVPEPATLGILGIGAAALLVRRKRA